MISLLAAAPTSDPLNGMVQAGTQALAGGGSGAVKIFLLLTALSFGTALLLSLTCFTRIIIVFSFLRQALGTPSLPPNQVLLGLSLFLTLFIMAPTVSKVHEQAVGPLLDDKISMSRGDQARRAAGQRVAAQAHQGGRPAAVLRDLRARGAGPR